MKNTLLLSSLFISSMVSANPLLGSWQFVEGKYATSDGYVTAKAPEITSVKLITPSHLAISPKSKATFIMLVVANMFCKTSNLSKLFPMVMYLHYLVRPWHLITKLKVTYGTTPCMKMAN